MNTGSDMGSGPDGQLLIRLRTAGGDDPHDELASLREWLVHEDGLRGRVSFSPPSIRDGQMGALSDVLIVALGGGGAVTVLARSLPTWLKQRRSDVTIEIRDPNGREVTVTANRIHDVEAVIRDVLRPHKARDEG